MKNLWSPDKLGTDEAESGELQHRQTRLKWGPALSGRMKFLRYGTLAPIMQTACGGHRHTLSEYTAHYD